MMISDYIEDLIYRVLSGEADAEERKELDIWLHENEEHWRLFHEIEQVWYTARFSVLWKDVYKSDAWKAIEDRRRDIRKKKMLHIGWSVAAAIVVLSCFSLLLWPDNDAKPAVEMVQKAIGNPGESKALLVLSSGVSVELDKVADDTIREGNMSILNTKEYIDYSSLKQPEAKKEVYNELIVPTSGEYRLVLSDGTVVYMNSESKLKYPVHFIGDKRVVKLDGEAYFEVAHDKEHPFIVVTEQLDVTVLGTGFNVMAYKGDARTEVTLVNGKVNVNSGQVSKNLIPNQQFVKYNANGGYVVREVDVDKYVTWKNGILNYDAMLLEELSDRLSRWYGVHFFFVKEKLKYLKFTGAFKKNENISHILELMEATMEVTFQMKGNTIIVDEK